MSSIFGETDGYLKIIGKKRNIDMTYSKIPDCIDDQGHYFKTCSSCAYMVCRRCNTQSYDHTLGMCSTYGDFSGTITEYDRYCDKCERLLKRGQPTVYSHSFKCYEDWEQHRIVTGDIICRQCDGNGYYMTCGNKPRKCCSCEGTGNFPSPSRIKYLDRIKKEKSEYPKEMTSWDLFLQLFKLK